MTRLSSLTNAVRASLLSGSLGLGLLVGIAGTPSCLFSCPIDCGPGEPIGYGTWYVAWLSEDTPFLPVADPNAIRVFAEPDGTSITFEIELQSGEVATIDYTRNGADIDDECR